MADEMADDMIDHLADIEDTNPVDAALRAEVRAWLKANWAGDLPVEQDKWKLSPVTRAWIATVFEAGWAVPTWPEEWFGRGLTQEQADIVDHEFARLGAPGARQDRSNLAANTMLAFGEEALKREMIPGLLKREIVQCLLYSEPAAGSDLAGVRTRAERDGDDYMINGQKVWTSGAAHADYGMLLARTDWDVSKHKGLTFFFFPMKQPGVEVRPLRQITDESHFNEVFITNARVPAANIMGGLNNGWRVLQTALAYERSTMGDRPRGARHSTTSNDLVALARQYGRLNDPALRQDLAGVLALRKLNALNNARAKANLEQGMSSSLMSLGKLAMSRILH
jgi:alkylation response protein AidB-like acyl-CoA dehydrogenase